jgi:hypothetical protein
VLPEAAMGFRFLRAFLSEAAMRKPTVSMLEAHGKNSFRTEDRNAGDLGGQNY